MIDMDKALKALDGDRELLGECLIMLGQDLPGRMEELRGAIVTGDWSRAATAAHTIKGSVAVVGASDMKEAALGVELAAKQEDEQAVLDRLEELQEQWQRLEEAIDRASQGEL